MTHYRAYTLDASGHILTAHDLECADDTEAITRAQSVSQVLDVELWQGERKVGVVRAMQSNPLVEQVQLPTPLH